MLLSTMGMAWLVAVPWALATAHLLGCYSERRHFISHFPQHGKHRAWHNAVVRGLLLVTCWLTGYGYTSATVWAQTLGYEPQNLLLGALLADYSHENEVAWETSPRLSMFRALEHLAPALTLFMGFI
jgi:hypothetical protein